jgi:hypothetical protein
MGFVGHLLGMPERVLHVPLLISGPGVTPGTVATPVQTVQLRATLRALLRNTSALAVVRTSVIALGPRMVGKLLGTPGAGCLPCYLASYGPRTVLNDGTWRVLPG